ncbi:hypothetical protein GXW71_17270 [Roseomonas hellenica]|uniref:DUF3618 domain-containing protein n=1 Tax=Plastoroseomonas hellenica TaxID=2687306 RepID=A0ABS5F0R1_9PROT|nr:hypothetical protein [Plastoroseomonas hellenica]MBR0666114.1 hypothetical protein [Plastoroseomonas hellenica]
MSASNSTHGAGGDADRRQDAGQDESGRHAGAGIPAGEATSAATDTAEATAAAAKAEAEDVVNAARARTERAAEDTKEAGARQGFGMARAIRHAAEDLDESSPAIAKHVRAAADSVEGVAEALKAQSLGDLLGKAGAFAQRQPAAFFGAAMLAGFAAARFAMSSGGNTRRQAAGGGRHER